MCSASQPGLGRDHAAWRSSLPLMWNLVRSSPPSRARPMLSRHARASNPSSASEGKWSRQSPGRAGCDSRARLCKLWPTSSERVVHGEPPASRRAGQHARPQVSFSCASPFYEPPSALDTARDRSRKDRARMAAATGATTMPSCGGAVHRLVGAPAALAHPICNLRVLG